MAPAKNKVRGGPEFLYVAGSVLSQYALGSSKPLHTAPPNLSPYDVLALDAHGRLVTGGVSAVTVFDAQSLNRVGSGTGTYVSSVAPDPRGYVYWANCGGGIVVLSPNAKRIEHVIRKDIAGTCLVAFDPEGHLYATDDGVIRVYALDEKPGRVRLLRSFSADAFALTFGSSGDLYIANATSHGADILVFAPNASSPKLTITDGIDHPEALAVDSKGTLYVANEPVTCHGTDPCHPYGWVSVYAAGSSTPLRRITKGINGPQSLATDSSGNLYVLNYYGENVRVYSRQGTKMILTIRDGLKFPNSLVVGS
jgi:DNA-binding beta-propeller fold protein YncE